MTAYKIAVIPGDGIGREVVPEGVRVQHTDPLTHLQRMTYYLD